MELGLGVLGLSPLALWSLTPRELQAALRGRFGDLADSETLTRHDLDALMLRYPDEGAGNGNHRRSDRNLERQGHGRHQ